VLVSSRTVPQKASTSEQSPRITFPVPKNHPWGDLKSPFLQYKVIVIRIGSVVTAQDCFGH
jgi:hypothetical protein